MTYYDFIEIGSCDFDTLVEKADDQKYGISIDVMQHYLDRLPEPKNCKKICVAISDTEDEEVELHYIPEDLIEKHKLPGWVHGGPRLYDRHPFLLILLNYDEYKIDPDEVYKTKTVKTKRLKTIVDENNVTGIKILKIDTEGMDDRIIIDYLDSCQNEGYPYPFLIYYEHILLPFGRREELLHKAANHGYGIQQEALENTTLIKKDYDKL